ncbi:TraB/GumN family protein [Paraburkholderia sp. CNPSo 3272]|uniref:TraB/GumN family protein n=1 Tax=Paraburkholderia sp. CNPSo 3272 TaxID=2940931 RepID=UPI0020B6E5E9|nr:TraB/GumN family protein [Paraburkholderia sp. CNPSo 3272]MCP3728389.1 TraB/GumN family protein [Paraburkholderia sp. CNPSo 3272]
MASRGPDIRATIPGMWLMERVVVLAMFGVLAGTTTTLAHAQSVTGKTEAERASAPNELHVMVWTATLPDHPTLLLVPTIHHLADDDSRIDVALGALADRVQAIVLEAPLKPTPAHAAAILRRYGVYPASDNITNHVSGMTAERLAQCARQSGHNVFTFFQLKPWLAALAATYRSKAPDTAEPGGRLSQMLGYQGIDQRLSSIAQAKKMPLIYLETDERGFRVFSDVPPMAQEAMLIASCENLAGVRVPGTADLRALEAAWISGDAALLDRLLTTRDPKESDALYTADQYIYRTNTDVFAAALARYDYFHGKGPILVAVGAGHFFGAASLLDRLRAVGYTVIPPQSAAAARDGTTPDVNRSPL